VAPDSIRIDSTSIGTRSNLAASVLADSSFIYDYDYERSDSSRLNLGGDGDNPMGLRLNYVGYNYRISLHWKPGDLGGRYSFSERSVDLGLFTLLPASAIDSVTGVAMTSSADTAGAVYRLTVQFTAPQGNSIGPNLSDSLLYLSFIDLPEGAGIPDGIVKDSVQVSVDNSNFYAALGVNQSGDSIEVAVPILVDASSSDKTVYVRIHGFVNPTKSDTTYGLRVYTEASPVAARKLNLLSVSDASYAAIKIVPPGGSMPTTPKYFDDIDATSSSTLKAGVDSLFKIVIGDQYGNVIDAGSAVSKDLVVKGPGATALSSRNKSLTVRQTYDGTTTSSSGLNVYDTLSVQVDAVGGSYFVIDSLVINPAVSGSYYVVIWDKADSTITDSMLITVDPTVAYQIAVSPDTLVTTSRGADVPMAFTATLYDSMGNVLPDSLVSFGVIYGEGTFSDTNGVAITDGPDTVAVSTDANGQALATLKAGTTDSIAVASWVEGSSLVSTKYWSVLTRISVTGPSVVKFITVPDDRIADTTATQSVTVEVTDGDLIKRLDFYVYSDSLALDENNLVVTAKTDTVLLDSSIYSAPLQDSLRWTPTAIPAKKLGTQVRFQVKVTDNIDSVVWSDIGSYTVARKKGKQDLSVTRTNVTDIMRVVFLVLGAKTPTLQDYLALDFDGSGTFDSPDLDSIRVYWQSGTVLAAAGEEEQDRSAKVELSYEEIDKASANLSINVENVGALNHGVFRIKYDPEKFVFGEASAASRLGELTVATYNNEAEGIYNVVFINLKGRPLASGNGAILSIPISAVGDKFDGTGEIALFEVSFDGTVETELNGEVLSPKAVLPKAFALSQNYPNPFNPSTTIAYDIPEGADVNVRLNIYNMRGQLIRTLVNEVKSEGSYKVQWDGTDNYGRKVASGVYFYRITAGEFSKTRKMVILK